MQTLLPLQPLFGWLLRNSILAALLVMVILLLQWALGSRLQPRWRAGLWVLVIARLLLPDAAWLPLPSFDLSPRWQDAWKAPAVDLESAVVFAEQTDAVETVMIPPSDEGAGLHPQESYRTPREAPTASEVPWLSRAHDWATATWAILIWLLGILVVAVRQLKGNVLFSVEIQKKRPVTDATVLNLLEDCKEQMKVFVPVSLLETDEMKSPGLFGYLRPRLILPSTFRARFSREELRFVFLHELAHLKRGDIFFNWIFTVLSILHWFNPVVWLALKRFHADRELATDALALAYLDEEERRQYGHTILKLLEHFSRPVQIPALAGILESREDMKRRILWIAAFQRTYGLQTVMGAALMVVLGAAAAASPNVDPNAGAFYAVDDFVDQGFEQRRLASTPGDGWYSKDAGLGWLRFEWDEVDRVEGRRALRTEVRQPRRPVDGYSHVAQSFVLSPRFLGGAEIEFAISMKAKGLDFVYAGVYASDGERTTQVFRQTLAVEDGAWSRSRLRCWVPPDHRRVEVRIFLRGPQGAELWLDAAAARVRSEHTGPSKVAALRDAGFEAEPLTPMGSWSLDAARGALSAVADTEELVQGQTSLRVEVLEAGDDPSSVSQLIALSPDLWQGCELEFSFAYRSRDLQHLSVTLSSAYLEGYAPVELHVAEVDPVAQQWQRATLRWRVPADQRTLGVSFSLRGPPGAVVWFDDAQLQVIR